MAPASARRSSAVTPSARRCLAASKRLTGRTATVRIGADATRASAPAKVSVASARRGAGRRIGHVHVDLEGGKAVDGLVGHQPVEQPRVGGGHARGAELAPRPRHQGRGRALQHLAAHQRAHGDHGRRRGLQRPRAGPGRRGSGPMLITGLEGPITMARARPMAASTSGAGAASAIAVELDALHRALGALADHELLERMPGPAGAHPRAHRIVGHREHARPHAQRLGQLGEGLGEPRALAQALGASQADRQVAVAQVEPAPPRRARAVPP